MSSRLAPASLVVLGLALAACKAKAPSWYNETRNLYNSIPVTVRYTPSSVLDPEKAWTYLQSIDDVFNSYRADSEVGKLNVLADKSAPTPISAQMEEALRFSQSMHEATDGAFDITVAPLIRLWGAAAKADRLPSAEGLAEATSNVGLDAVAIGEQSITVQGPRAFDFGGVIKGMAADHVARMLEDAGATSVFVQVGNETVAFGPSPKGRPSILAIEDPKGGGKPLALLQDPGTGLSATTSTNTKQPRIIGGVTYYHIVDPRTGQPVPTRTLSVTVAFAEPGKAGVADALATAVAVLGPEAGIRQVVEQGGEALVIVAKGQGTERHATANFKKLLYSP